jgi:HEAT repeat protein
MLENDTMTLPILCHRIALSPVLAILLLPTLGTGQSPREHELYYKLCQEALQKAGIKVDHKSLVTVVAQFGEPRPLSDIDACIKDLGSSQFQKREDAVKRILKIGPSAIPHLKNAHKGAGLEKARRIEMCMKDLEEKRILWSTALWLLKKDKVREVIPVLWKTLGNDDDVVRRQTEEALVILLGPDDLPRVLQAAKDKNPRIRSSAVMLFHKYRTSAPDRVVPLGLEMLRKDESPMVRIAAIEIFLAWFSQEKGVINALLEAIEDEGVPNPELPQWTVGKSAVSDLGLRGEIRAVPVLKKIVQEPGKKLRATSVVALGQIANRHPELKSEFLPLFENILDDRKESIEVRRSAACSLKWIGEKAVTCLAKALKEKDSELRYNALLALETIGPKSKAAVPEIISILRDSNQGIRIRKLAVEALGRIGPNARAALPVLRMVDLGDPLSNALKQIAIECILKEPAKK